MINASLRTALIGNVLGAVGAVGVAVFGFLLAQDSLNHVSFASPHLGGMAVSLPVAAYGGFLDRARSVWFGWLSYGALMPSAIVVLSLGVPSLQTGTLSKTDRGTLFVGLLIFAVAFLGTLIARRRARSRLALVQSNNRWRGP